jgi:hypothetical protein
MGRTNSPIWNISIPAGETYLIPQNGTMFEFLVQTGAVAVRTRTNQFIGQFNTYPNGTGEQNIEFEALEVKNLSATVTVAVSMFVGDSSFINRQLILAQGLTQQIIYPTAPKANVTATIDIVDLSGSPFTDLNSNQWIAINRVAILVFNLDTGATYLIQKAGTVTSNDNAGGAVYPLTSLNLPVNGNFRMATGGANINCIVSEIYQAVPQT